MNINGFWLKGIGYDITIGEDARGDPYIIIAINRTGSYMKLQENTSSWRGKTIKIIGTSRVRAQARTKPEGPRNGINSCMAKDYLKDLV